MNKKIVSGFMAVAMTFGLATTVMPAQVSAADDTAAQAQATTQAPRKSMVLSMKDVASIFLKTYPNSAVHSVTLDPLSGNFDYVVTGYTLKKSYTLDIDIVTGKIKKTSEGGRVKELAQKVFNPTEVIGEYQAQNIAANAVGAGAVAKSWILEADNGSVTYDVLVYNNNQKSHVIINAKNGEVISQSKPVDLPVATDDSDDDDRGFTLF